MGTEARLAGDLGPMPNAAAQINPSSRPGPSAVGSTRRNARLLRDGLATSGRVALLAALVALTGWNVTRSSALDRSETAYRRGDLPKALGEALAHLDRRPWSRPARRIAALSLSRLDFATEAERYYRQAGRLDLDDLHVRALGLVRSNRREEALAAYREILAAHPGDLQAMRRMGAELMSMSRWAEALVVAERLAATPGGEVDGFAMIGAIRHHTDQFEEAAAAYERVLEIDPELTQLPSSRDFRFVFWSQLCWDLLRSGRPEQARRHLERALAEWDHPGLVLLLGRAQHHLGNLDEAERLWRRALEMDPTLSDGWLELGRLLLSRPGAEAPERALPYLERAAALAPRSYEPPYSLALAYRRLGRDEEARRCIDLAEELRRRNPPPATGMGAKPSHSP